MSDTVTRARLGNAVYREVGFPLSESLDLVDGLFDILSETLGEGEVVKISNFGSFDLHTKNPRVGRNPKTGVEVEITARTVLSFTPSNLLRKAVNKGLGGHVRDNKDSK